MNNGKVDMATDFQDFSGDDACVDALRDALSMLKTAESGNSPSLAEILRLVRLMESQPNHAMEKLKSILHNWTEMPTAEKIRYTFLQKLGHTEESLRKLASNERDALEAAVAMEIRRHFGIGHIPMPQTARPHASPTPPRF